MGIDPITRADLEDWVALERVEGVDRALVALGGVSARSGLVLAVTESRTPEAVRFAQARALWRHARSVTTDSRFILTAARTPVQQAERAFAAEFLAPAGSIRDLIADDDSDSPVDLDDVAAASDHFRVNEWVIEYQIINLLGRDVDDPDLARS